MKSIHLASLSTSLSSKISLIGVMGGLAIVALSVGAADAATILNLSIQNGSFNLPDGTTFSGTFDYNKDSGTYSNWNITTLTGTLPGFNYTTATSFTPRAGGISVNSPQQFSVQQIAGTQSLILDFVTPLTTLTTIGATSALIPGAANERIPGMGSRGIAPGGTVRVNSITITPEPATLLGLGSVAALGFFGRKRKSKDSAI